MLNGLEELEWATHFQYLYKKTDPLERLQNNDKTIKLTAAIKSSINKMKTSEQEGTAAIVSLLIP